MCQDASEDGETDAVGGDDAGGNDKPDAEGGDALPPFEPDAGAEVGPGGMPLPGGTCPAGTTLQYGKCVPLSEEEIDDSGDKSGGCATGAGPASVPGVLLLLTALLAGMRRSPGRPRF
jgi:hypothetical protein